MLVAKPKIQFGTAIRAIVDQRDLERGTGKQYRFDQLDAGRRHAALVRGARMISLIFLDSVGIRLYT
jgi:hypothetical protein